MEEKENFSVKEIADLLGVSRIAIFKRIQKGQINAKKVGRSYIISKNEIDNILGQTLTAEQKKQIDQGIKKTLKEYGEALEKLGEE